MVAELTNHLWQSTVFAVVAGLLAIALRRNRAQVRYWLWLSASLKFLVPFALLLSLGSHLERSPAVKKIAAAPAIAVAMEQIAQPFPETAPVTRETRDWRPVALFGVWACGFAAIALIRFRGWLRIRAAVRASTMLDLPAPVEIRSAPGLLEPGVVGAFRPILLLPQGIAQHLTPPQLEAVLAHELCHVRRRDNLFASMHMLVEAMFWFHPLVWWIGARLVEERERACDEEVLTLGSQPRDYAAGILNVCKLYVESPLACVSGVTGSDLKRRIHAIMTERVAGDLNFAKKLALALSGIAALTLPIGIGIVRAQQQQPAAKLEFEVASVRMAPPITGPRTHSMLGGPGSPDPGQITYTNAYLKGLIAGAYGVNLDQISAPDWVGSQMYDIAAKVPPGTTKQQFAVMLQNLLAERFQLKLHHESREFTSYQLTIGKRGPKLKETVESAAMSQGVASGTIYANDAGVALDKNGFPQLPGDGPATVTVFVNGQLRTAARGQTLAGIIRLLSNQLHGNVADKTGLTGKYDFTLEFAPVDNPDDPEPSIFAAVEEQLGLKLAQAKESLDVIVIDHIEKVPTEN